MSSSNLSYYDKSQLPDAASMRIGIVVSEWNSDITENLLRGAMDTLIEAGVTLDYVKIIHVPGSYELPSGAQFLFENTKVEGVICLGSVVRGETPHFEFVCNGVAQGVKDVALRYAKPCIFGVLTDNTIEQSRDRSGGRLGNKGIEAAVTALKMIALQRQLEN